MAELDGLDTDRFWRVPARFVRATLVGGVVFLVPLVVLAVVLGKALGFFHQLAAPLARLLPPEVLAGVPTPRILAVLLLVFVCFLAGLLGKTRLARRTVAWLESVLLSQIPGYTFMKSMGEQMAGVQGSALHEVVLARIEDAWQIAFLVERLHDGQVAVFIPGAPNPWSGSVYLMTQNRIKPLEVPPTAALKCIKQLGIGSDGLVRDRL